MLWPITNTHANTFALLPPTEPVIYDDERRKVKGIIGPYNEGEKLKLLCESDGVSQTKTNGNVRLIRPAFELALSSLSPLLSSSLEPINRLMGFIKPKRLLQEVLRLVLKAKH
ncbi:hypothetical protein TNCT_621311 [Trichonephila clavata]|uniref:Uncharacterized protein n=1 Tax=Trichonephila clavata TaxID=2740835 RepID=A0A8X6KDA4_TRICU|nr:hypothetical protein TNCT_621311 [Trichonephila clavata]